MVDGVKRRLAEKQERLNANQKIFFELRSETREGHSKYLNDILAWAQSQQGANFPPTAYFFENLRRLFDRIRLHYSTNGINDDL